MRSFNNSLWLCFAALTFLSLPTMAAPISSCAADFSSCIVYEGQILYYPDGGFGYSGDVIIDSSTGMTVNVFRVFNDLVDAGGGTGLGLSALLYADDLDNLPDQSTYSLNAVEIARGVNGPAGFYETDYNGNGTIYRFLTPAPEPSTLLLFALGTLALRWFNCKRSDRKS